MLTPLKSEVLKVDDLAHEARRFRTILWSFERNLELLLKGTGLVAQVDHAALAEAFSRWRQGFDQTKHLADIDRQDFVLFAAGLMLKELIATRPITAVVPTKPALPDTSRQDRSPSQALAGGLCLHKLLPFGRRRGAERDGRCRAAGTGVRRRSALLGLLPRERGREPGQRPWPSSTWWCGLEPNWAVARCALDAPHICGGLQPHRHGQDSGSLIDRKACAKIEIKAGRAWSMGATRILIVDDHPAVPRGAEAGDFRRRRQRRRRSGRIARCRARRCSTQDDDSI